MVFFPGCSKCTPWCCDWLCQLLVLQKKHLWWFVYCPVGKRWVFKSYRYNSLENSLGICIYTIYSDDNSWYGLWWFVFPESAKHEFAFSIIAWKIHLVPVYSDMVCDGLCTVLMPEPAKEELVSPLPFCPWHSSAGQTYIHPYIYIFSLYIFSLYMCVPICFPYIYIPYIFSLYICVPDTTLLAKPTSPKTTIKYKTDSQTWKSVK